MNGKLFSESAPACLGSLCVVCVSSPCLCFPSTRAFMLLGPFHVLARFCPFPSKISSENLPLKRKRGTRNKFLFDNNKNTFFSDPSNQQASYKEEVYLLFEGLAIQLCFLGMIRRQDDTFAKPCGFKKGQSSFSCCHLYYFLQLCWTGRYCQ